MKVLCVTGLFPDRTRPTFAPFNLRQILALSGLLELRLISPVPWTHKLRMFFKGHRIEPPSQCAGKFDISYPVYFYPPGLLRSSYGRLYYLSIRSLFDAEVRAFRPDLVYATWAYPDCYAAYLAAKRWNLPIVLRVHGSDINEYMRYHSRRRRILEAIEGSDAVVVVSRALKDALVGAGVRNDRVQLVYNGIDRSIFYPRDRSQARRELGLDAGSKIVLFAGNLKIVKGVDILIDAFGRLHDAGGVELHILGEGPLRDKLRSRAGKLLNAERVFFHGAVPHDAIPKWLTASDVVCLPSRSEGTPNIVLEALACGRPVVASNVGGVGEIISESSGILFPAGDVSACEDSLRRALEREWKEEAIICPAPSWEDNAAQLVAVFKKAVDMHRGAHLE